eukprot:2467613-Pleurochrysis_carterae.AAC.1
MHGESRSPLSTHLEDASLHGKHRNIESASAEVENQHFGLLRRVHLRRVGCDEHDQYKGKTTHA